MAKAKKRDLGAAKHLDPSSPDSAERVVSADFIETLAGKVSQAGFRAGEKIRDRSERKAETPRGQRRQYDRERSREQQRIKREAANGDPLAQLELDTRRAQESFIRHLRESDISAPGRSKQEQRRRLSAQHQEYVSRMVAHCLGPIRRGVSVKSVFSTVGMSTAMWLLSPNFRAYVGDQATQMVSAMGWGPGRRIRREAKIIAQGEKSRAKETAHLDRTGQGRESMSRRHRKRLERIERMERGDRDLFTEHSAALAHVGLLQNAYDQMRSPGANRALIKQNYESALSALYGFVADDGLDREAVQRNMRVIVGGLIERDPSQSAVFSELGHGRFVKGEPQTVVLPGATRSAKLWTGDYVDAYRGDVVTGGSFTLREPMSTQEHRAAIARTMYGELAGARGPAELKEVLEQYLIGSVVSESPESMRSPEGLMTGARYERAQAMFASMRGDGLNAQEQRLVYMGGLLEARRELERTHPQMSARLNRDLGPEWERRMRDLIEEYTVSDERVAQPREQRQDARAWAEPKQRAPHREPTEQQDETDVVDAELIDDEPEDGWRSPSPEGHERGATPRPAEDVPVAEIEVGEPDPDQETSRAHVSTSGTEGSDGSFRPGALRMLAARGRRDALAVEAGRPAEHELGD